MSESKMLRTTFATKKTWRNEPLVHGKR